MRSQCTVNSRVPTRDVVHCPLNDSTQAFHPLRVPTSILGIEGVQKGVGLRLHQAAVAGRQGRLLVLLGGGRGAPAPLPFSTRGGRGGVITAGGRVLSVGLHGVGLAVRVGLDGGGRGALQPLPLDSVHCADGERPLGLQGGRGRHRHDAVLLLLHRIA